MKFQRLLCIGTLAMVVALLSNRTLAAVQPVTVNWLEGTPKTSATTSFGVPWAQGQVTKTQQFTLTGADGKPLPVQTWPLAYWADGSIKWSGFATAAPAGAVGPFTIAPGAAPADALAPVVRVTENAQGIDINTGRMQCHIAKTGGNLFDTLSIDNKPIAEKAQLECILQKGVELDPANPPAREKFLSNTKKITVEQSGPVRAVVKIEGMHKSTTGQREWLPFTVRLYFFAGLEPIRMVHSFVFDGDQKDDLIRGLGVVFSVPFREEVQNRHIRLGGEENGLWSEPVQPYLGGPGGGDQHYAQQINGQRLPNRAEANQRMQQNYDHYTKWTDFRLIQPNADGFTIEKRTNTQSAWIKANAGKRSNGMVYVGDVTGGLAVGLKDFWQSYPTSLEVSNALTNAAQMHVWLWSPDAPAMDLRHYDTVAHGLSYTYEDVEEDLSTSTPYGVARTHDLMLFACDKVPTKAESSAQGVLGAKPAQLVCTPQYLHDQRAFGIWSVDDRSTPFKQAASDYLNSIMSYYQKAIEQNNWYGFWDFGDVMHSYDEQRHEWKYDIGGCAWDNSEQGTDMVFWYMFLRTGRADFYRMAEAMSRHTGEVDCYHMGPLAGLGSRHNVRHWGCGAKEARISMAPYRRFYYYLTTDERTGDVMHEMLQADEGVVKVDPMRKVIPPTEADKQFPTRIRGGPDWFALAGNWMTEWERTGDTKWRDKIYAGMDSIAKFPFEFNTSQSLLWGFFPESGKLVPRDLNRGGYNLTNQMGGPEIIFELNTMIDNPAWQKVWRDYCEQAGGGRFAGYMYVLTKDPMWAQRAMGTATGRAGATTYSEVHVVMGPETPAPLDEGPTGLITNNVNQSTLQMIQVLDMVDDQLPKEVPPPVPAQGRGRGPRGRGAGAPAPATQQAPAR